MARERYITRTIASKETVCKVYDLDTDEIKEVTLTETGAIGLTSADTYQKHVSKLGHYRFLKVVGATTTEYLYRMLETDFIKYGEKVEKADSVQEDA